jgi:hypothetical protein
MADQTYQFACDNTAYVNIVVQSASCSRITIGEYYTSAVPSTTDLLVKQPATAANPAVVLQGTSITLTPTGGTAFTPEGAYFNQGQIVGAVKTVAGSVTIQQVEGTRV